MSENNNHGMIMKTLDWAYETSMNGAPGVLSAQALAAEYLSGTGTLRQKAGSLVKWQMAKAGTSGFIAGLGGVLTLPVAIPANLASVIFVQIRMIASIAIIGGHDINSDRVKSMVFVCLTGNSAKDILKDIGIILGKKMATQAVKNISRKTFQAINRKVGFKLLTKFGEKGVINLGKAIPIVGGVIGGFCDSATTSIIGNIAISTFVKNKSLIRRTSLRDLIEKL